MHAATLSADTYQRIAATGGSISVSTESEQSAGQGYPPTWQVRQFDIPVSLSMDTSVWWSGDLFSAMRTTLGADRSREHLEAHVKGDTVTALSLRAEHVVDWATRGGAKALGRDDIGSLDAGQEGRRRPDQERRVAGLVPAAQPVRSRRVPGPARRRAHGDRRRQGREARGQAGRHRPAAPAAEIEATVEYLRSTMGEEAWHAGHEPRPARGRQGAGQPVPVHRVQVRGDAEARESMFGDDDGRLVEYWRSWRAVGAGPDFVEALARGLDVLACFDAAPDDVAERGRRRGRAGPADRAAAAAHPARSSATSDRSAARSR